LKKVRTGHHGGEDLRPPIITLLNLINKRGHGGKSFWGHQANLKSITPRTTMTKGPSQVRIGDANRNLMGEKASQRRQQHGSGNVLLKKRQQVPACSVVRAMGETLRKTTTLIIDEKREKVLPFITIPKARGWVGSSQSVTEDGCLFP